MLIGKMFQFGRFLKNGVKLTYKLQEALVLFAANFIRWASRLFGRPGATGRKRVSTRVNWASNARCRWWSMPRRKLSGIEVGKLLQFSEHSAFAGQVRRRAGLYPSPQKANF